MHATCKKSTADLKLIDNLIVSPDTSTANGQLCWLSLQNQEDSGQKQQLIVCVLSVTEWLVSNVTTHTFLGPPIQLFYH